ncbi:MAG: hypothetical protein A2Y78_10025 [Acidobacteria bacterium RBG_13_68_16]|jgi:hypothetical protein|nr:MAG: hypothetical protein A2Y78_10025 [Acidobacteria bacterium RBG_13_68_16]
MLVLALMVAGEAWAVTVVLTGGKRLDVTSYSVSGSYVTVQYANGRRESYPLSAVDLPATRGASGEKTTAGPAPEAGGPHSPFLGARSSTGAGAIVVTDADVQHVEPPEAEEEKKEEGESEPDSQVVLVSYEKRKVSDGEWEISATVANQGKTPVQGVTGLMRVLDDKGKPVATGSGSLSAKLDPGKQGTITARVTVDGEPVQVAVDLSWQEIRPVPKPVGSPAPAPAAGGAAAPQATSPQAAAPAPQQGWAVASGSSPNSLPANLMGVPAANVLGSPGQVPRGEPKQP